VHLIETHGQYCPIAKGAEVLGERWTLVIVRELLFGVEHFNELQRCLPGISRSVLSQRLRRLEQTGIIERRAGPSGRTLNYTLTEAGRQLKPVVQAVGEWAASWAFGDPNPDELDPDLVMRWISRHVDHDHLPATRRVACFHFTNPRKRYWLVMQPGDVSVCAQDPGYDIVATLTATTATMYDIYLGRVDVATAVRADDATLTGTPSAVRQFPHWFQWSHFAPQIRHATTRQG
jgi:DNA-binding HxlR family transcriptional regulator